MVTRNIRLRFCPSVCLSVCLSMSLPDLHLFKRSPFLSTRCSVHIWYVYSIVQALSDGIRTRCDIDFDPVSSVEDDGGMEFYRHIFFSVLN